MKIRKDVHDGWNTNDVEVLTDFLQFHHICKYRQNFYSVKSHIFQVVGVVVFGIAVWVIVDAPKFTELFDKARVLIEFVGVQTSVSDEGSR